MGFIKIFKNLFYNKYKGPLTLKQHDLDRSKFITTYSNLTLKFDL